MKPLLLVLVLAMSCSTPRQEPSPAPAPAPAPQSPSTMTYRLLSSGSYSQARGSEPKIVVVGDAAEYARVWNVLIGSGEPPAVDFATESAIFLLQGERNTGGYAVQPTSASLDGETAVITVEWRAPGGGDIVTQAFTYPYAVISVSRPNLGGARWVDSRDGRVVASETRQRR